jgi:hypothetical protein
MTQSSSIPTSQYIFPNISFNTSISGPLPFTPSWRNTIGVAGVFSRGPVGPSYIGNRQDFAYLYGEDNNPGSLFVQQAMLQGATNFYVSRVMPDATASSGSIYIQSATNQALTDAQVGSGNRTIGLSLELSYIGSPIIPVGQYTGTKVNVNPSQNLFSAYSGAGSFDFTVVEQVINLVIVPSSSFSISVANIAGTSSIQLITASGAAGTALNNNAKPGRVILPGTGTYTSTGGSYLKVLSYPYQVSAGVYGVLVQGSVVGVTGGTDTVTVSTTSTSDPAYYVLAANYRSADGSLLPSTVTSSRDYTTAGSSTTFITVPVNSNAYQTVNLYSLSGGVYSLIDTGIAISFGTSGTSTNLLISGSTFSVPIVRSVVTVGEPTSGNASTSLAFTTGTAASTVLGQLVTAIQQDSNGSSLINVQLDNTLFPYTININSAFVGLEANRVFYKFSQIASAGTPTDFNFPQFGQYVQLTGGQDEMHTASLYLYDKTGNPLVYIEALSPGVIGNSISLSVKPQTDGSFTLYVVDTSTASLNVPFQPESYNLSNYSTDPQSGLYVNTSNSYLIRAYFVPILKSKGTAVPRSSYALTPQRVAPFLASLASSTDVTNPLHPAHIGANYLQNLSLTGGKQPADYTVVNPANADFISAIQRLEQVDCATISVAGVSVADSRYQAAITELVAQAGRSSTTNGLRIAIIPAPPNLSANRASSIVSGVSSDRVVVVAGYATMSGALYLGVNSTQPIGYYAGVLASIPPYVSPASVSSGQAVTGVISVDTLTKPAYLDALTRAYLEVLYYDPSLGVFKFLNGLTTSTNQQLRYVSIRRITDQIITDLYSNLIWVRSSPNTTSLQSKVASACDAYFASLVRNGSIASYSPTICDASNNTIQSVSSGQLNITLSFTPLYPADYIQVNLIRDLTTNLAISTSSSS